MSFDFLMKGNRSNESSFRGEWNRIRWRWRVGDERNRDEMSCRKLLTSELLVEKAERDESGLLVNGNCVDEMKK